jgi:putative tRNA adenosine deaminase-associated protein
VTGSSGTDAYAVIVFRQDDRWELAVLPDSFPDDLHAVISALRQQPGENGAFALVDVADEFFVAVRVSMGRVRVLLSDVTAGASWELAAQVLDFLDLDVPAGGELDDVRPAGDLGIFDDLGLDAMEMAAILSDLDAYADEMLSGLAVRLGFSEPFERVVDALAG